MRRQGVGQGGKGRGGEETRSRAGKLLEIQNEFDYHYWGRMQRVRVPAGRKEAQR